MLFDVSDGSHDVRVAHVSRGVVVLVHGENAGVSRVHVVKRLEIRGVHRDEGEAVGGRFHPAANAAGSPRLDGEPAALAAG